MAIGSTEQIATKSAEIKEEICALLNGKGGVILFDVSRQNMDVFAKGVRYL